MLSRRTVILALVLLLVAFTTPEALQACPGQVVMVHPEVSGAHAEAIDQIRAGLRRATGHPVEAYALARGDSPEALRRWLLARDGEPCLVTLGRRVLDAVQALGLDIPVYAGALEALPDSPQAGVSIFIDPERFFRILKALTPRVHRVHVIYRADRSAGLVPAIISAGQRYGFEIIPTGVTDLPGAARAVTERLDAATEHDAIWLHRGVVRLNEKVMLKSIVPEAWRRRVPVFTSEADYVRWGILFSLFPDFESLGYDLGQIVRNGSGGTVSRLAFLASVKAALNGRIARHLDANLDARTRELFDVIYPVE